MPSLRTGHVLANVQSFTNLEIESFPATDINPKKSADAPELILNREFGNSFSKMYLYQLTWSGKTATLSKAQIIPLSRTYQSPNGASMQGRAVQPAPGDRVRADKARRTTCVYAHGDSIFSCNAAKNTLDSRCGVFWCEIRAQRRHAPAGRFCGRPGLFLKTPFYGSRRMTASWERSGETVNRQRVQRLMAAMRSVPISHSINGPLARSIGPGFTGG